jgi:hypothetical protein
MLLANQKRTNFMNLLENIEVMKELAITSNKSNDMEKELIHMCYLEYDNKQISIIELRTLIERI